MSHHVVVDYQQISRITTDSVQADGTSFQVEGYVIPVIVPVDEAADWLAQYDSTSATSPSAADSRLIARPVLDALKQYLDTP